MFPSTTMDKQIVMDIIQTIQLNKEYLSQIDGEIGDGDHGVNMNKGFTIAGEMISQQQIDMSGAFSLLANTLITRIGGSIGPLYGTIFDEMSKASKGAAVIDINTVRNMFRQAVESIAKISPAKQGDKTLMDVLLPATEALETAREEGADLKTALNNMKIAAEKGKESTREMVAKIGRSSRLGERSKGVLDAGAVSLNLILQSFANSVIRLGIGQNE